MAGSAKDNVYDFPDNIFGFPDDLWPSAMALVLLENLCDQEFGWSLFQDDETPKAIISKMIGMGKTEVAFLAVELYRLFLLLRDMDMKVVAEPWNKEQMGSLADLSDVHPSYHELVMIAQSLTWMHHYPEYWTAIQDRIVQKQLGFKKDPGEDPMTENMKDAFFGCYNRIEAYETKRGKKLLLDIPG